MREAIARLVWIGAGGNASAWDEVKARDRSGPNRPNYVDEKADEAWATADLILEHLSGSSSTLVFLDLPESSVLEARAELRKAQIGANNAEWMKDLAVDAALERIFNIFRAAQQ